MEEKRLSSLAKPAARLTEAESKPLAQKEVTSVVSKSAKVSKKGPIKRMISKLFADDFEDIKTGIISDTLVPAIRDMIFDAITNGLSMSLYGNTYSGSKKRRNGSGGTDYSRISSTGGRDRLKDRRESSAVMGDLVFEEKDDAISVMDNIMDMMETYDLVSVADVYSAAGIHTTPTDNKYGWDNINDMSKMKIVRSGRDWCLKLPRPYPID